MTQIPPPRVNTIETRESLTTWINNKEFNTKLKFFIFNNLELILNVYNKLRGYYRNPDVYLNRLVEYSKATSNGQKVAIVTGANSGIGYVTAKYLYQAGYYVILACRSKQKAEEVIDEIRKNGSDGQLKFIKFDGNSLKSVEEFAEEFKKLDKKIDLLVNNAGIMMCPYGLTDDGIESQIGVNFVSHYLLTNLLIPYLNDPAKIINLTSLAAFFANKLDLTQILDKNKYDPYDNYAQSKLANMLYAYYLHSKLSSRNITVYAVHPGAVSTNLTRMNKTLNSTKAFLDPLLKSAEAGTFTTMRCAFLPPPANHGTHSIYYAEELPFAPHIACLDEYAIDELINWAKEAVESKGFKLNSI